MENTIMDSSMYETDCFPFAVNCRFSKTLIGVPKRCGYCQKMIIGTGFTCQHCSFRCHKRCIMIGQGSQMCLRPKQCSLSRLPAGDNSLMSKIIKENEINSNDVDSVFSDGTSKSSPADSCDNTPRKMGVVEIRRNSRPLAKSSFSVPPMSVIMDDPCCSGSLQSASTATSPSLVSQPTSPGPNSRKSRRGRRFTAASNSALISSKLISRRSSAVSVQGLQSNSKKLGNGFMDRLFKLLPSWAPVVKIDDPPKPSTTVENGCAVSVQENSNQLLGNAKPLLHTKSTPVCHQVLTRTDRSLQASPVLSNANLRPRLHSASEKTSYKIDMVSERNHVKQKPPLLRNLAINSDHMDPDQGSKNLTVSTKKSVAISPILQKFRHQETLPGPTGHKFLRTHESDPIKIVERKSAALLRSRTRSREGDPGDPIGRLASTWPLAGYHIDYDEFERPQIDENADDVNSSGRKSSDGAISVGNRQPKLSRSDLGEWTIPYTDLVLNECIYECRNMTTYKGRWHGDVMIHTFEIDEGGNLISGFLEQVRTLTKIRHENVALFMGASVEAPLLAVVTSIRKGCNLYETIHLENRRLAQNLKLNIARQVAQGMAYLHAKGIILKTLTSKSIYLECKAKISMVDDGAPLKRHDRPTKGCIRRGHLTYISPELTQSIRVCPPALNFDGGYTKESDVYAFGTILYEMFSNEFPFTDLPVDAVVWCIGTGKRQNLDHVQCPGSMKGLIDDCWSADPVYRPSFTEILKELQHTAAANRKHSSSVPEKLNKAGSFRTPYNF